MATRTTTKKSLEEEKPPAGAELLRPVQTLRSDERSLICADLLEPAEEAGFLEDGKVKTSAATMRAIGKMHAVLREAAVDQGEMDKFMRREDSFEAVTDLALWYVTQLTK